MDKDQTSGAAPKEEDGELGYVGDDQLPTDLVPGEDNPLAERADEGESAIDPEIEPGGARERPYEKGPDDGPASPTGSDERG